MNLYILEKLTRGVNDGIETLFIVFVRFLVSILFIKFILLKLRIVYKFCFFNLLACHVKENYSDKEGPYLLWIVHMGRV